MAGLSFHAVVLHPAKLSSDSSNLLLFLCDVLSHITTATIGFVSARQLLSALVFNPSNSFYPPSMDLYSQEVRVPSIGAKISGI